MMASLGGQHQARVALALPVAAAAAADDDEASLR